MQGFPLPPGPPTGAEPSSIVSPNHPYYGTPQATPGGPNTNNQRYHEEVLGHYWHFTLVEAGFSFDHSWTLTEKPAN